METKATNQLKKKKYRGVFSDIRSNWQLYAMIAIPFIWLVIFAYMPMYGAQIAFKNYRPVDGILGSEWVGLKHFIRFFNSPQCWQLVRNTVSISVYSLLASVPLPIMLALGFNYLKNQHFKKAVQMVTYLPHFLSTVIIVSLIMMMFNSHNGVISLALEKLTGKEMNILGQAKYYRHLYVWSGVWQGIGWSSILYVSALAGVDPSLHEAAVIDGASKIKRVWHIDLPCILPTVAIMLVKSMGTILSVGFDKTFMMQNPTNLDVSEVFSTYEYKRGIAAAIPEYSYPAAIGLSTSIISFMFVMTSNKLSNKLSGYGLW